MNTIENAQKGYFYWKQVIKGYFYLDVKRSTSVMNIDDEEESILKEYQISIEIILEELDLSMMPTERENSLFCTFAEWKNTPLQYLTFLNHYIGFGKFNCFNSMVHEHLVIELNFWLFKQTLYLEVKNSEAKEVGLMFRKII